MCDCTEESPCQHCLAEREADIQLDRLRTYPDEDDYNWAEQGAPS